MTMTNNNDLAITIVRQAKNVNKAQQNLNRQIFLDQSDKTFKGNNDW